MKEYKKIALVTSASNFEKQKNIIHYVHKKLKEMGGYVLYVFTNYGLNHKEISYDLGAVSIYELLKKEKFDACLIEENVGSSELLMDIIHILRPQGIPMIILGAGVDDIPCVLVDSYDACYKLMKHLILEHHCQKINMVCSKDNDFFTTQVLKAFVDIVNAYGINQGKDRIVRTSLGLSEAEKVLGTFQSRGIDDADAVVCAHDVFAIGLCIALKEAGIEVPENVLLGSLNRSSNSIVFRPDVAGVDRMDSMIATRACELMEELLEGKNIPLKNYIQGKLCAGESCGCMVRQEKDTYDQNGSIIFSKIEAAKQVSSMMEFNASLEQSLSLEEIGSSLQNMMERINCREFLCNLNQYALDYVNLQREQPFESEDSFGEEMTTIVGVTQRSGVLRNVKFPTRELLPIEKLEGDIFLFFPIHQQNRVLGYIVFVNEYLPVDMYNYRICHESISSSIENLYRKMVLCKKIEELDFLHMKDGLTGLYNRFGLERYREDYIHTEEFCVVSLDMDGLKMINDTIGHLAGNHAICIVANSIKELCGEGDLITRCGGDEFQILSKRVDEEYWKRFGGELNQEIEKQLMYQKFPYQIGVSVGYCISTKEEPLEFETCYAIADKHMYENKKLRKQNCGDGKNSTR